MADLQDDQAVEASVEIKKTGATALALAMQVQNLIPTQTQEKHQVQAITGMKQKN